MYGVEGVHLDLEQRGLDVLAVLLEMSAPMKSVGLTNLHSRANSPASWIMVPTPSSIRICVNPIS